MFEVYWDDSGTHEGSPIAIAACYISTVKGWTKFVEEFNDIRHSEEFDCFHMADFAAYHEKDRKPWCDWDYVKRKRVYGRIAGALNPNKRVGFGFAVPKEPFDRLLAPLPEKLKDDIGRYHYTYAVRCVMGAIQQWREQSLLTNKPIQYIFDHGNLNEPEIARMWHEISRIHMPFERYGMEKDGYSFQCRCAFKPLQAADILAWQLNSHMQKVILAGKDDVKDMHRNMRILRENQSVDLYFMDERQLAENFANDLSRRGYR